MEKYKEKVNFIAVCLSLINVVVSFAKGWWSMHVFKEFWDGLTPGAFTFYLLLLTLLAWVVIKIISYVRYGIPRKWILKLGVYWDENMQPYCTNCCRPMYGAGDGVNLVYCSRCKTKISLTYRHKHYAPEEAGDAIRKGEI